MRAITFQELEVVLFETIDDPTIEKPSDIIVKTSLCGVCGSDMHVFHGRETGIDRCTAMGHEFVGEVVEVGSNTSSFKKGERVMAPFTTSCGHCYFCRTGLTSRCVESQLYGWREKGSGLHGAQAEYVRVPNAAHSLMSIPNSVSDIGALMLGDNFSTGYFCAAQGECQGKSVVVLGCGSVGLSAVMSAISMGATTVLAVDNIAVRLAKAKELGATALNFEDHNLVQIVQDQTEGRGVDVVLDAVGNSAASKLAFDLVSPGGIISTVGVCTDPTFAFSPAQAYDKNLTYKVGRCPARYYMEQLLPLVEAGEFNLEATVTHKLPLEKGADAYAMYANKTDDCIKIVLEP